MFGEKSDQKKHGKGMRHIDKMIPLIVFAGPIMTIPQVYKIWESQNAAGVSLTSWVAYSALSFFWILYAFAHKERVVLLHNILYFIVCTFVVIGVLSFS